jgi:hypothetical protein
VTREDIPQRKSETLMPLCRLCLRDDLTIDKLEFPVMRFGIGKKVGVGNPVRVKH